LPICGLGNFRIFSACIQVFVVQFRESEERFFIRRRSYASQGLIESVCRYCGHVSASRELKMLEIVERAHDCPGLREAVRQQKTKPQSRPN